MKHSPDIGAEILIVDDDPAIQEFLSVVLQKDYRVFSETVSGHAVARARELRPDLILLDVRMPDIDGFQVCAALKQDKLLADIPIVFMTASSSEEDLEKAFAVGGADFIRKPISIAEVRNRIGNQLRFRNSEQELVRRVLYDSLTDLPNRGLSIDRLESAIAVDGQHHLTTGLLCVDLDNFKSINDALGYDIGDQLLLDVADRMRRRLAKGMTLGRLGADEFVVVLPSMDDAFAVDGVASAILACFEEPFVVAGMKRRLSASIGVAISPDDTQDAKKLMACADAAMAEAKAQGKAAVHFYTHELHDGVSRRLIVAHHLFDSLEQGQLTVEYQPQVDVRGGRIIGAEALLRWHHPELGAVSPEEFIREAEHSGLIWRIGAFVLRRACEDFLAVSNAQGEPLRLAVNVSVQQIRRPEFAEMLDAVLKETGFAPERLEVEVTESLLLNPSDITDRNLMHLRRLGVRLSMDDFGTGYSSLSYLSNHHFDVVKIDRSFVREMLKSVQRRELVHAIISMAHALNLGVIAEGVEEHAQFEALHRMGCDFAQGFLISPSLSLSAFRSLLQQSRAEPGGSGFRGGLGEVAFVPASRRPDTN